jgi:hypothetical protein
MVALVALLAALVALLAACGSTAAPVGVEGGGGCGPDRGLTLASSGDARVYGLAGAVFGCSDSPGRSFRLGARYTCLGVARVGPVAVAGRVAAYGLQRCGVDTGRAQVVVRRLTDGRQLVALPAVTEPLGVEAFQRVGAVVVTSGGAVAWIGIGESVISHRSVSEVHAFAGRGARLLDSGPAIDAGSLRLSGSTVSWRSSGARRSAKLR